jgi:threonine dehydratase
MAADPFANVPEPSFDAVREAQARIGARVHRTPVMRSRSFNEMVGADVLFKCESLQRGGSFKIRGALNAVLSLDAAAAAGGIVAHSSGNHGAAVALAARERGVPAHIVVPHNSARTKIAAAERYGAKVSFCEPTMAAREATVKEILARNGGAFVHPFDNPRVIAGQGTATLELLEDDPGIEIVLAPVSGGGLLSGTSLAAHGVNRAIRVIGVEPRAADDAARSLASGRIEGNVTTDTIADGLRATICARTFALLREHVDAVVTVTEDEIISAMRTFADIFKLIIEPSSAVTVAGLLNGRVPGAQGRRVGVIISGGNVDLDVLPWRAAGASR